MATYTDARALSAAQRTRAGRLRRSLDLASQAAAQIAFEEAQKLSAGTLSTRALRRLGHPFARRGARAASVPTLPINRQTGRLFRAWRVFRRGEGRHVLQNTSPASKYVLAPGGTKTMIDRRFWDALAKASRDRIRAAQLRIWRKAAGG